MLESKLPESEKLTGAKKRKARGYKPPGSEWIPRTPRSRLLYDHVRKHFMQISNSASIPRHYIPVDPDLPPVVEEFEGDLALYGVDPEEIKKYEENFEAEAKSSFKFSSEHDSGTEPVTPSDKQCITPEAVSPEDDDVFDSDKFNEGSFLRPRRLLPQRSYRAFSFEVDSSLYEGPSVMSEEPSTDFQAAYKQVTKGKKRLI